MVAMVLLVVLVLRRVLVVGRQLVVVTVLDRQRAVTTVLSRRLLVLAVATGDRLLLLVPAILPVVVPRLRSRGPHGAETGAKVDGVLALQGMPLGKVDGRGWIGKPGRRVGLGVRGGRTGIRRRRPAVGSGGWCIPLAGFHDDSTARVLDRTTAWCMVSEGPQRGEERGDGDVPRAFMYSLT